MVRMIGETATAIISLGDGVEEIGERTEGLTAGLNGCCLDAGRSLTGRTFACRSRCGAWEVPGPSLVSSSL